MEPWKSEAATMSVVMLSPMPRSKQKHRITFATNLRFRVPCLCRWLSTPSRRHLCLDVTQLRLGSEHLCPLRLFCLNFRCSMCVLNSHKFQWTWSSDSLALTALARCQSRSMRFLGLQTLHWQGCSKAK